MKTRLLRKLRKEAREKYYVVKQGDIYYVMTKEQGEIHRVTQYPHCWSNAKQICDSRREKYIRREMIDRYKRVY